MRRWAVLGFIILSLIVYTASGSIHLQPEHQAYVICMGLEHTPEGKVRLSVLCPKISGEASSEYQSFDGEGDSVSHAMENLQQNVPRHLVYVQLKSLLLSEEFAASDAMEDLIYYFLLGGEFYSDAWVMICPQSPSELMPEYSPLIGTRLSTSILATLQNAVQLNSIPTVHLADMIDGWNSIFGDVLAISCHPEKSKDALALIPDGAALFSEDRLALQLDAYETGLMNWLRGDMSDVTLLADDAAIHLRPETGVKVSFDWEQRLIQVSGRFVQRAQADSMPAEALETILEQRIARLISKCQQANVEPFLFSDKASRHCADIEAYKALNFREFYRTAQIQVELRVRDELA